MGSLVMDLQGAINNYIFPFNNAMQYAQYDKAAWYLWKLNNYLVGFGEIGIVDLPPPPKKDVIVSNDIRSRTRYDSHFMKRCRDYIYEHDYLIDKAVGAHNWAIITEKRNRE